VEIKEGEQRSKLISNLKTQIGAGINSAPEKALYSCRALLAAPFWVKS